MIKILPFRFKQSFGSFNMLTVHKWFDTGPFKSLVNPPFQVYNFGKKSPMRVILF